MPVIASGVGDEFEEHVIQISSAVDTVEVSPGFPHRPVVLDEPADVMGRAGGGRTAGEEKDEAADQHGRRAESPGPGGRARFAPKPSGGRVAEEEDEGNTRQADGNAGRRDANLGERPAEKVDPAEDEQGNDFELSVEVKNRADEHRHEQAGDADEDPRDNFHSSPPVSGGNSDGRRASTAATWSASMNSTYPLPNMMFMPSPS